MCSRPTSSSPFTRTLEERIVHSTDCQHSLTNSRKTKIITIDLLVHNRFYLKSKRFLKVSPVDQFNKLKNKINKKTKTN